MSSENIQTIKPNTFASRLFDRVMTERKKDEEKKASFSNSVKVPDQAKQPVGAAKN